MIEIFYIVILTLYAGLAMPSGAFLASKLSFKSTLLNNEIKHSIVAFGGGALLSAVALVLVPEGIKELSIMQTSFYFILGSFCFMAIDIILNKLKTSASQLVAMLIDFIPESLALGAMFVIDKDKAILLASLIALQNLPEGFNAFHELKKIKAQSDKNIIFLFILLSLFGPIAGLSGYLWLNNAPEIISAVMIFASGGILYSIFQDIAPQVPLENHWLPPFGAILGFLLGIVGSMLTM